MRIVLSGSAAELGKVDDACLPVNESYSMRSRRSLWAQQMAGHERGVVGMRPLEVMVARVFNPIGPGTPANQALGRFASRLLAPGHDPLDLAVGDLNSWRDFIDVRDVARAMVELALRGRPGLVYHVGTGRSQRVGDGLERLVELSGARSESASTRSCTGGVGQPIRGRTSIGSRRTQAGGP